MSRKIVELIWNLVELFVLYRRNNIIGKRDGEEFDI
jgi:hypothetical protein